MAEPIEQHGMSLAAALEIIAECRRIFRLMGTQAAYPYHQHQLARAMFTLADNYRDDAVDKDELFLWKRKWTALNAQNAKLRKQLGIAKDAPIDGDDGNSEGDDNVQS